MSLFRKRPPTLPHFSREDAINCVPAKRTDISESRLETGEVLLVYPLTVRPLFAMMLRRLRQESQPPPMKKLQLDQLGSGVWMMIDGRRTVQQIIQWFAKEHTLQQKEAELSVTAFLRELGRRGLIGMKQGVNPMPDG